MQRVIDLIRTVDRQGVENVIEYITKSSYATARCNKHHRYKGGLVDHSLEVYEIMKRDNTELSEESIIICSLFHDLGKARLRGWNFEGHHPERAIAILKRCGFELTEQEAFAIRYHHRKSLDAFTHPYRNAVTKADMESTAAWKRKHGKLTQTDALFELIGNIL